MNSTSALCPWGMEGMGGRWSLLMGPPWRLQHGTRLRCSEAHTQIQPQDTGGRRVFSGKSAYLCSMCLSVLKNRKHRNFLGRTMQHEASLPPRGEDLAVWQRSMSAD